MTNKKISLIIFLVVIVGSIVLIQTTTQSNNLIGCAIPNDYLEKLETNRLILELDMVELPDFIGKEFEVNFTAVTKADFITVSMYFDGLKQHPVWEETADFFVNKRARINLEEAQIITGIDHEFTIRAYDSDNNSDSITKIMSIDMINPTFLQLSLEKCSSEEGIEPELIEGGYLTLEESKREYLRINYTAYDENFKCVKFFIDTREDVEVYPFSSTAFFGNAYFIIDNPFLREQTFMFKISAFDLADNEESFIWQVRYIEDEQGNIPEWQYEQDMAAKDKEKQQAAITAGIISITFTIIGVILGICGSIYFIRRSGWQSVLDNDQLRGDDDEYFMRNKEEYEKDSNKSKTLQIAKEYKQQLTEKKPIKEEKEKEPIKLSVAARIILVISAIILLIVVFTNIEKLLLAIICLVISISCFLIAFIIHIVVSNKNSSKVQIKPPQKERKNRGEKRLARKEKKLAKKNKRRNEE